MSHTLKVFGTGQITIPKILRDKYGAKNYRAKDTKKGILLEPLAIYEEVVFDPPIPAKTLSKQIKKYIAKHDK